MASKTGLDVQGLAGATAIAGLMEAVQATEAGADWVGGDREEGYSNAQVVQWLADGGRDIRANETEQAHAANLLANELVKQMNEVGRTVTNKAGASIKITAEKQARAGIVGGLRKAAKYIAAQMYGRIQSGQDNTGKRTELKIDEKLGYSPYARQRKRKHRVNESVLFIASRQLGEAAQKGIIKIRFNSKGLAKALGAIGR